MMNDGKVAADLYNNGVVLRAIGKQPRCKQFAAGSSPQDCAALVERSHTQLHQQLL